MFKIKICGITSPEDALLAAEAGADAIGLNFYEQSPRYVTPERGGVISEALRTVCENRKPNAPLVVGVFVHPKEQFEIDPKCGDPVTITWGRLYETQGVAKFDGFQLHGDEPPELIATMNIPNFPARRSWLGKVLFPEPPNPIVPIIRAFRCREPNLLGINDYLRECASFADKMEGTPVRKMAGFSTLPHAVLLDAYQPGAYGGTGQVVDWNVVRNERDLLMGLPVILAGGLTPENVAEAIATARPDAVDVASGVESSPGKKDPDKVRRFIAEAKRAFEILAAGR